MFVTVFEKYFLKNEKERKEKALMKVDFR